MDPPPPARLFTMHRPGGYKNIYVWIIHCHEIMLVFQGEWGAPSREGMPFAWDHGHWALFRMVSKYSSQQAAQHQRLIILCSTRVDSKQSIPFIYIILESLLNRV